MSSSKIIRPMLILPRGTVITCPNPLCAKELAVVERNLYKQQTFHAGCVRGLHYEIKNGQKMRCFFCNKEWAWMGKIHTKKGWLG